MPEPVRLTSLATTGVHPDQPSSRLKTPSYRNIVLSERARLLRHANRCFHCCCTSSLSSIFYLHHRPSSLHNPSTLSLTQSFTVAVVEELDLCGLPNPFCANVSILLAFNRRNTTFHFIPFVLLDSSDRARSEILSLLLDPDLDAKQNQKRRNKRGLAEGKSRLPYSTSPNVAPHELITPSFTFVFGLRNHSIGSTIIYRWATLETNTTSPPRAQSSTAPARDSTNAIKTRHRPWTSSHNHGSFSTASQDSLRYAHTS